jgi:hypothetical protein
MASNHTASESEDDMTLSQEILVLDFGDEKNSQFLRSEASSSDFSKGDKLSCVTLYIMSNIIPNHPSQH